MLRALIAGTVLVGAIAPALADKAVDTDWRSIATQDDRARLRNWRSAWVQALAKARKAGNSAAIARQGNLFEIDRALDRARPPAGDYRCRVFKLGGKRQALHQFAAYPAVPCRVDDDGKLRAFHTSGGPQRPVGLMFEDSVGRGVFLGTMMFGDEARPIDYGRDAARDLAGYVEHVDAKRWRIVLPWPHYESLLDVIELVPAG